MATKNAALRNKIAEDFGVLFNGGKLIIRDGSTVLVEFDLETPAFGSATAGKVIAAGLPISESAIDDGDPDNAILESSTGTYQLTGLTVGTTGTDVIINTASLVDGQPVDLIDLSWEVAEGIA